MFVARSCRPIELTRRLAWVVAAAAVAWSAAPFSADGQSPQRRWAEADEWQESSSKDRSVRDRRQRRQPQQARLREGVRLVDRAGRFELEGDSANFTTADGYRLAGLPNLSLQRIVQTLKTMSPSQPAHWIVSGQVTEFAGRNYLLISRAVYRSTPRAEADPTVTAADASPDGP